MNKIANDIKFPRKIPSPETLEKLTEKGTSEYCEQSQQKPLPSLDARSCGFWNRNPSLILASYTLIRVRSFYYLLL